MASDVYEGLRRQVLDLDPADVGFAPTAELPDVYALVLELGMGDAVATLVTLLDGTTSLYTSSGGGMIGDVRSEVDLSYLSLWYTAGRDYGLHDGEWKMTGGSENANSVLIASEPLTRDTAAWMEVPEYCMLHAAIEAGRPLITLRDLR